ncbi:hypothetical protein [Afipia broomeae]|nr:hypothetical protein [Afipia broomeae]
MAENTTDGASRNEWWNSAGEPAVGIIAADGKVSVDPTARTRCARRS